MKLTAVFEKVPEGYIGFIEASVVTSKPAIGGHLKTGHRTSVRDSVFYSFRTA
jgi:hypothetical protein